MHLVLWLLFPGAVEDPDGIDDMIARSKPSRMQQKPETLERKSCAIANPIDDVFDHVEIALARPQQPYSQRF